MKLNQPSRGIYVGVHILTTICLLPYYLVIYARRSKRPKASWSLAQSVYVSMVRRIVRLMGTGHLGGSTNMDSALKPESLKRSHPVMIPPIPMEYIKGEVLECAKQVGGLATQPLGNAGTSEQGPEPDEVQHNVAPRAHPGYWFLGKEREPPIPCPDMAGIANEGLVYLHFHGGGYAMGTADENGPAAEISRRLVEETRTSAVLSASYRLADAAPFPAALIDAIGSYYYLTKTLKIPPSRIVVGGDSAGGNLALALVRFILHTPPPSVESADGGQSEKLEPPAGLMLLSPRADLTASHHGPGSTAITNQTSDVLGYSYKLIYSNLFRGYKSMHKMLENPYVSPAWYGLSEEDTGEESFEQWPKTFILAGGGEMLLSEIMALRDRMIRTGAKDVTLDIAPDMPHDFLSLRPSWIWEPEVTNSFRRIATWLDNNITLLS